MKRIISLILVVIMALCLCTVSVSAATGQDIVNDLNDNYVGKYPYVLNTHGPKTFDCSGLVYYVYKQHGVTLPYVTSADWTKYGTVITDRSQLKSGDILLFGSSKTSLNHIGIYDANGGYIIQALNSRYGIIRKPTLSEWVSSSSWNSNGSNQFQYAIRVFGGESSNNSNSSNSGNTSSSSSSKPCISNPNRTLRWKELNSTYDVTTKELQECLNYIMKAGLKVDGKYGIATHDVVKEFQGQYGLKVDGDAGPQTLKKVNEVLSSMGGGHTHSFTGTWHEAVHPHREYRKCSSCGETELTGNTVSDANCAQCTTPGKPSLLNMKQEYVEGTEIKFTWNPTVNTTHYNLYISKQDASGEYKYYENVFYAESGMTRNFDAGKYKVFLQPTNSNAWTDDKSTWRYTNSDMYYFEVTEKHTHEYAEKYDKKHPHKVYKECDCGDIQYSDETKKVKNCEECYPHEHDYVAKYETTHPHEKYWICDCGEMKETGETKKISGCSECYPIVEKKTLKLQIGIPNMYVDGQIQEIDPGRGTAPVIQNERTLLPIRMVMETFGAYVLWNEIENKVTIYAGDTTMEFWINNTRATVDGKIFTMDVAPTIINERTFMPLRFIAENMGLNVGWNGINQTVTIEGEIS
ncbi:MAG: C40 family peptidase [Clostridia bacterium]|nr:C40 family peptidase [Clostridia bacterium]